MKKEWAPQLLSVLRIVVAFLFIQVGSGPWSLDALLARRRGTVPVH